MPLNESHTAKSVLLACFDFPPNMGIGGRRWAKLAKGLAVQGYRVFVIKSSPVDGNQASAWTADIHHPNIFIKEVRRNYPRVLSHGPRNTLDKVMYRVHRLRLRLCQKGTIYDVAANWEHRFMTAATHLIIEERITTLVATGAPFNLLYYSAKIKAMFPFIRFIADYRDPWLSAQNYGMAGLSRAQRNHERFKQNFVFQHADLVVSPYAELNRRMQAEAVEGSPPTMAVLPHFYDPSDFASIEAPLPSSDTKTVDLLYGGTLYIGCEPHLQKLAEGLQLLKRENRSLYDRLRIEFYTHDQSKASFFSNHPDVVSFIEPIGKRFFERVAHASGLIVLLAEHNRHFATTKFFEYLPWRKPLFYIGPEGDVSNFIVSHQLGSVPKSPHQIAEQLTLFAQGQQVTNLDYPVEKHSLSEVTKQLIECFETPIRG